MWMNWPLDAVSYLWDREYPLVVEALMGKSRRPTGMLCCGFCMGPCLWEATRILLLQRSKVKNISTLPKLSARESVQQILRQ
ncbi:protein of unknown function [Burkholderia multivorans]